MCGGRWSNTGAGRRAEGDARRPHREAPVATVGKLFISAVAGWAVGFAIGMLAVRILSSNQHDRSTEAAMTGAFVVGPLCALIAMVIAWFRWVK